MYLTIRRFAGPTMAAVAVAVTLLSSGCADEPAGAPRLRWYVFYEPSGAFARAATRKH